MGLIATYSCLSDANLKELKAMGSEEEEILESYCLISTRCGMYSILC